MKHIQNVYSSIGYIYSIKYTRWPVYALEHKGDAGAKKSVNSVEHVHGWSTSFSQNFHTGMNLLHNNHTSAASHV